MTYGMIYDTFLQLVEPLFPYLFDPLLIPLLGVGSPLTGARLTVLAVAITLAAILSLLYYFLMDLDRYQELQEKRKEMNEKMREAQEDGEMGDVSDQFEQMMDQMMEMYKLMMKPMLVSMVVFFLVLPWMYTTFTPVVELSADDGAYSGEFQFNGGSMPLTVETNSEERIVVDGETYAEGDTLYMDDLPWAVRNIQTDDDQASVKLSAQILSFPFSLPLIGNSLGWLGSYIIFILPFSYTFRKLLGVQ